MSSHTGDAAEQVVRLSLDGTEMVLRLAGSGTKQMAILLASVLKDQKRTKGKVRLASMLRSGKKLKVFAVRDEELKTFCTEAKKYGVLYTVLKDRDANDGVTDVFVRDEDSARISRIFDRFRLSTVDMGSVLAQTGRELSERAQGGEPGAPGAAMTHSDKVEEYLDRILRSGPGGEAEQGENPTEGRTAASLPSGPSSETRSPTAKYGSDPWDSRPSVRRQLDEIRQEQKKAEAGARRPGAQTKGRGGPKKNRGKGERAQ